MEAHELNLDNPAWASLNGGYRVPYDPRPTLRALEAGTIHDDQWSEMVANLYHQGDVGDATYATVPHLTRIYSVRRIRALDTYQFAAMVELARRNGRNPPVSSFCLDGYKVALAALSLLGLQELPSTNEPALISSIIAVVALEKGQHRLAQFAGLFDESERTLVLKSAGWIT